MSGAFIPVLIGKSPEQLPRNLLGAIAPSCFDKKSGD